MSLKLIKNSITNIVHEDNLVIVEPVNLYGCSFGRDVFIGPFVEIQSDVVIGDNVRIQSHTFICQYVNIGNNSFVGHSVVFINDLFSSGGPARGDINLWKSTFIGENVSIGSNASILPVKICNDVVIGAGAVVVTDITEPGVYVGNPARKIK